LQISLRFPVLLDAASATGPRAAAPVFAGLSNNAWRLTQGDIIWYAEHMAQSTITDKFQTTIPLKVRQALKLSPRQRVSYEVRRDGSAVMRPVPRLEELFGSVKLNKPAAGAREEKQAARDAIASEASGEGLR
jgi:bifunctional DNA-binding transcriptional regulator/antitoxin component of YhaV-PrlF toxin-antitoxin module